MARGPAAFFPCREVWEIMVSKRLMKSAMADMATDLTRM